MFKRIPHYTLLMVVLSSFITKDNASIQEVIDQYFLESRLEKVILHTDKPYYIPGDNLWYSAHLLDYRSFTKSELSEILHLEILNRTGAVVFRQKMPIEQGFTNGMFEIPDSLKAGYYLLRGSTNWINNFEEGLSHTQVLKIVTPTHENTPKKNTQVNFHKEGGTLLSSKLNHLVFSSNMKPEQSVLLVNQQNDTLDHLSVDANGNGKIKLLPSSPEDNYYILNGETNEKFRLPSASNKGTTLRLEEDVSDFKFFIECSDSFYKKKFYFIILKNGQIVSNVTRQFDKAGLVFRLPKHQVAPGLNHLLIIDEELHVLNERLFYNQEEKERIELEAKTSEVSCGDSISIKISHEFEGISSVSLSVIHDKYFDFGKSSPTSAISYGKMGRSNSIPINDFLISQKMDDYHIQKILNGKSANLTYPIEKKDAFYFNYELMNGELAETMYHSISLKKEDSIDFYFKESKGKNLSFITSSFYGECDLILKPSDPTLSEGSLRYTEQRPKVTLPSKKDFYQTQQEYKYAILARENKLIRRFYNISENESISSIPDNISLSILRSPDLSIALEDYIPLPDVHTISKELLGGVRLSKNKNEDWEIHIQAIDESTGYFKKHYKEQPLRIIDGVRIDDTNIIADLDPLEIEKINIKYGEYNLNGVPVHGVFWIETSEGNYGQTKDVGQSIFKITGFSNPQKFKPTIDSKLPDFRSLLYWNPKIELSGRESREISFLTSDEPGQYLYKIRCFSDDGMITEKWLRVDVTQK